MYGNVKLWFARDSGNNIVTVNEVNDHNTYSCPACGSDVIPKATKSKQVSSHFAHIDKTKCSSESMIHWWFKNKFLEVGDKFEITSDETREYICQNIDVEVEHQTEHGIYRPDVTIATECGETIYFEMAFSNHKTVKDYLDMWLELGNIVVEVDIKNLTVMSNTLEFKALFYKGKCFNTKRNDTYYNTIGKYKEEKLNGSTDEKLREHIKKLDWFWEDVLRYKKGQVNIKHIISLIDGVNVEDRGILYTVLDKQKCIPIYEEYLREKSNYLYTQITSQISKVHDSGEYNITLSEINKKRGEKYSNIQLKFIYHGKSWNTKDRFNFECDVLDCSVSTIINKINNNINTAKKIDLQNEKIQYARSNESINNTVERIDRKYKSIDEKYNFYKGYAWTDGKIEVHFCYGTLHKVSLGLPDEIIYSNDESYIEQFFENEINKYMRTINRFENKNEILKILDKMKNVYNNYILRVDEIDKGYSIWRKIKKEEIKFSICYSFLAEDLIQIKFNKGDVFIGLLNPNINICLYYNKLYRCDHIKNPEELKDAKLIKEFKSEKDWKEFENILKDIMNKLIQKDMHKNYCVDCGEKLFIELGEINFFINKKFILPRKCKSCRTKRKQTKHKED